MQPFVFRQRLCELGVSTEGDAICFQDVHVLAVLYQIEKLEQVLPTEGTLGRRRRDKLVSMLLR